MLRVPAITIAVLALVACSTQGPGAIEGTWSVSEPFPVTVTFRTGEMEAMGATRQVAYKTDGDAVLVTYKEGANKGNTFRYTVVDDNTIRSESGTFRRTGGTRR